VCLSLSCFCFG
jgi:cyclic nucleotide gated channel